MTVSRRSLFASALALLGLPRKVAGERLLAAPVHDDTDYLQGILDRTGVLDGRLLENRVFTVSRPLVPGPNCTAITGMRIRAVGDVWKPIRVEPWA